MSDTPETPETASPCPAERTGQIWAVVLAVGASLLRYLPHWWNFTPIGAVGLFAGARLPLGYALALTFGIRLTTDIAMQLGADPVAAHYRFFFSSTMYVVYFCLLLNVLIGRWLCQRGSIWRIGAGSLTGAVLFFLVTNFVCWIGDPRYPATFAGLMQDYAESLPFFEGTFNGDLLYAAVLFGSHAFVMSRVASTQSPPTAVTEE